LWEGDKKVIGAGESVWPIQTNGPSILGVFDGHGGYAVSQFVMETFPRLFLGVSKENVAHALDACDRRFRTHRMNTGAVGSTAIVVQFTLSENGHGWTLETSNVGDSRAVLVQDGSAVALSVDHSPDTNPAEMSRLKSVDAVLSKGGFFVQTAAWMQGVELCTRVYNPSNGEGGLNMSRALGDYNLKSTRHGGLVIPNAEVTSHESHGNGDFVIIASDGLWDVISPDIAATTAKTVLKGLPIDSTATTKRAAVEMAAVELVQKAQKMGSSDNITVMVAQMG
jgi:serine/threonine protein phosphatase PrpC